MLTSKPKTGEIYRHYKSTGGSTGGNDYLYEIIGVRKNTENDEVYVIYKPLYDLPWLAEDDANFACRPLSMFMEDVEIDGIKVPRFKKEG